MSNLNQSAEIPSGIPDLHFGNIAAFATKRLAVAGVIVLVSNEDGTIGMTGHGVNHARANEMLSVGIHLNLSQHYDLVRQGAAGAEAAEHIRDLDNFERKPGARQFRKKPVVVEAITFDELVQHGIDNGANIVGGMPWSFSYKGHPITHENNTCYIVPTLEGSMRFTPDDMLITGVKGEIYPCKKEIFAATYDEVAS